MSKLFGGLLILGAIAWAVYGVWSMVKASYEWDSEYGSYWSLSVKASTIEQKAEYVDRFVVALEKSGLQGSNNALLYFTPDNSFDNNMKALKSLQSRLHDIKTLDENSFAYQTAIQQITAQEQDENSDVIGNLNGSWMKVHHYYLWNTYWVIGMFLGIMLLFIVGVAIILSDEL